MMTIGHRLQIVTAIHGATRACREKKGSSSSGGEEGTRSDTTSGTTNPSAQSPTSHVHPFPSELSSPRHCAGPPAVLALMPPRVCCALCGVIACTDPFWLATLMRADRCAVFPAQQARLPRPSPHGRDPEAGREARPRPAGGERAGEQWYTVHSAAMSPCVAHSASLWMSNRKQTGTDDQLCTRDNTATLGRRG